MRIHYNPIVLLGGLALTSVQAAPIRIITFTTGSVSEHGVFSEAADVLPFRFGHAAAGARVPPISDALGEIPVETISLPVFKELSDHPPIQLVRVFDSNNAGCGGRFHKMRNSRKTLKAAMHRLMNRIRLMLGLPVVSRHRHTVHPRPDGADLGLSMPWHSADFHGKWPSLAEPQRESVAAKPGPARTLSSRVQNAIESLSPLEAGAVAFVLGCGLGALLRMFVVMGILLFRGSKCPRRGRCGRHLRRTLPAYDVPPAYVESKEVHATYPIEKVTPIANQLGTDHVDEPTI